MASSYLLPAQPADENHDTTPLGTGDSRSYLEPDEYDMDIDNFETGNFETFIPGQDGIQQFDDDTAEETPIAPQNVFESEAVRSETDTKEHLALVRSIEEEMARAEHGFQDFDIDIVNPYLSGLEIPIAMDNTQSFSGPAQPLGQQDDGRILNFGSNLLERQATKQHFMTRRYRDNSNNMSQPSPSLRHTTPTMPPPHRPDPKKLDAEFRRHKKEYNLKKKAGTLTTELDIEYIKAKATFDARQRKIAADRLADEESSPDPDSESGLFISEATEPTDQYQSWAQLHADDSADERAILQHARGRGRQSRKRKVVDYNDDTTETTAIAHQKPAKRGRKAKEYTEGDVDDVLNKIATRKKSKAKDKPKAQSGGRNKNRPDVTNKHNVLGMATNVFKDTEANAGLEDQPTFSSTTRKADALKQLIASVPQENRKTAAADKRFLDEACKAFAGTGVVKAAPDGNWLVKGMKSTLKHYQVLGTAFMRKRETELSEPRGGILADEMGLGKTVMMLANIVNGKQPSREKGKPRCTLIVASPALCHQWESEITKHTLSKTRDRDIDHAKKHGFGSVVQHRANHRLSSNDEESQIKIEEADICLTTYGEICKSYPKAVVPLEMTTARQKDGWRKRYFEENKGVFHRVHFHRVVLDEAQIIKKHTGNTSLACRALKATHYWAITGTPVMNRLTEFYPYFKFLREPHTASFKIFKENFCTPDDSDGTARLAVFLRKIMIRRTHLDTLFGARLLDLPQPKQTVVWLKFNEIERQIYEIVKNRFIQRINSIAKKDGSTVNQYNHIWTMILRLRQLCAHILLVQETIVDLLQREDFEKLNALCMRTQNETEGSSILLHLRDVIKKHAAAQIDTVEAGAGGISSIIPSTETAPIHAMDFGNSMNGSSGGKHGLTYNFGKYISHLTESDLFGVIEDRSLCSACRQPPVNVYVTSCFHIYCYNCIEELQHYAARTGRESATCVECGTDYTSVEPCQLGHTVNHKESFAASDTAYDASSVSSSITKRGKKGRKAKSPKKGENDWIGLKGEVLPSTKTIACKAQILEWIEADPTCKIIVYTQFMPVIRILSKVCNTEKWNYVSYKGDMSQDARDRSIKKFAADADYNIMLCSLRCGGLGLNLTMAQHVILIDPWWNAAIEQQAFCRVFRIGQRKETRMTRFVVENTIDATMMVTKERKEAEIDEVMESPRLKEKLSVEELMRMFGEVRKDEGGKPFIFANNVGLGENELWREEDEDNEDPLVNDF